MIETSRPKSILPIFRDLNPKINLPNMVLNIFNELIDLYLDEKSFQDPTSRTISLNFFPISIEDKAWVIWYKLILGMSTHGIIRKEIKTFEEELEIEKFSEMLYELRKTFKKLNSEEIKAYYGTELQDLKIIFILKFSIY